MSRLCVLLLLLLPVLCSLVSSVQFYLPVNSVKCLREDIHQNVLVTGEYVVSEEAKTTTDVKITDSSSYMLFTKNKATKGVFSFTTETPDHFDICFHSTSPGGSGKVPDQLVTLNIKHGVESMTYKEIEDTEKLTPLEAKLRYLEELAESIADDFKYLKKRGKERRQTTASTNTRVLLLSIFSMGCLSALAMWQVFYLRRFFRRKKLIE